MDRGGDILQLSTDRAMLCGTQGRSAVDGWVLIGDEPMPNVIRSNAGRVTRCAHWPDKCDDCKSNDRVHELTEA